MALLHIRSPDTRSISPEGCWKLKQKRRSSRSAVKLRNQLVLCRLPRVEFDDELFVDDRCDLFPGRDAIHGATELLFVDRQPIRHGSDLGQFEILGGQAAGAGLVLDEDGVTR